MFVSAARRLPRLSDARRTALIDVALLVGSLAVINSLAHFTELASYRSTVPLGVIAMVLVAIARGYTPQSMGISQASLRRGLRWAGISIGAVTLVVGAGLALPFTREFFLNDSYANLRRALVAALVIIPLQTVVPEELAFRGMLHSALDRLGGTKLVFGAGSLLFGLWHVSSSLGLTASNAGLTELLGSGSLAKWIGVGLAVVATAGAGAVLTWLRHHTDSVIAPIGLHWALNATGALAAAAAWTWL
ncbi:CAAX amino terminal protease self- immunity [Corynebacterium ciconiae DSM 44920]|uniref:CPBP family intramembrane glutamic endopeptidase n=1 Tax=Corynebacterium ciconiae TaxID=227319 RepID=UPI000367C18D|nr:CPBP family intramembrane glutamic endopeptidase [Corynebacterium ciconiae]WKD60427.1 CAAX amino terminal protease self- immunity [Corynebacterium ciconiae DSM 44920]